MASSVTHDLYAGWTGRNDPRHLLRVGKLVSAFWGVILMGGALFFHYYTSHNDTPVVVLALSIASVTYGTLLGTYILAARSNRATGPDIILAISITIPLMLIVIFAKKLALIHGLEVLAPVGRLAWPWYVPIGTLLTLAIGWLASARRPARQESPA